MVIIITAFAFCDLTLSDWMENYVILSRNEVNNTCIYNLTTNRNNTLKFNVNVRKFDENLQNRLLIEDDNTRIRTIYGNILKESTFYLSLSSYYVISHDSREYFSIQLIGMLYNCVVYLAFFFLSKINSVTYPFIKKKKTRWMLAVGVMVRSIKLLIFILAKMKNILVKLS